MVTDGAKETVRLAMIRLDFVRTAARLEVVNDEHDVLGGNAPTGAAGNVGGYNAFWLDPGSTYTVVNGEKRTSLVVELPEEARR